MDKAEKHTLRKKHKESQRRLNREALALMREDWLNERYRMLCAMVYRFSKWWLFAVLLVVFGMGTILLASLVLTPDSLHAEFDSMGQGGVKQLSDVVSRILVEYLYLHAVCIGVVLMVLSIWAHYIERAKRLRSAADRLNCGHVDANAFPSTAEERQASSDVFGTLREAGDIGLHSSVQNKGTHHGQ